MGLKDKCFLAEFAPYPTCELIDDMHCDDGGIVKHLLTLYQSTDNDAYLSPGHLSQINKLLTKARYPREIKNGPKPLGTMHYWATHEFRTFFHFPAIYVFKDQWQQNRKYYYHLIKYILFLRLLSQDYVSNDDIDNSQALINSFVEEFLDNFGLSKITHNVHTAIHLPRQVVYHAPLHKCNCYAGEFCFKDCHGVLFGSRYTARQIGNNIGRKNVTRKYLTIDLIDKIECEVFRNFCHKSRNTKFVNNTKYYNQIEPLLEKSKILTIIELPNFAQDFFLNSVNANVLNVNTDIITADKLYFNRKCNST